MNNLGSLLHQQNILEEGVAWYQAAADGGYALAMVNLADCLYHGKGIKQDAPAAEVLLRKAKAKGCVQANLMLADILKQTAQGSDDFSAIAKELESALIIQRRAKEVSTDTLCNLAETLLSLQWLEDDKLDNDVVYRDLELLGIDVQPPPVMTPQSMTQADIDARRLRQKKRPLTPREVQAISLWEEALKLGNAKAGIRHGKFMLHKGMDKQALDVFCRTATQLNSAEAYFQAGMLCSNDTKCTAYLLKAGKLGHEEATFILNSRMNEGSLKPLNLPSMTSIIQAPTLQARQNDCTDAMESLYEPMEKLLSKEELAALKQVHHSTIAALADATPANTSLRPGADVMDNLSTLLTYLQEKPDSFNAQSMAHSCQHFLKFHLTWNCGGKTKEALHHLFYAYAFDEKAVQVGMVNHDFDSVFKGVEQQVNHILRSNPNDVGTLVLKCWLKISKGALSVDELSRAIVSAESSGNTENISETPSNTSFRLVPYLLHLRGSILCFQQRQNAAIHDFEKSLSLLQTNPQQSLWPYEPNAPSDVLQSLRRTMVLQSKLSIARASLSLPEGRRSKLYLQYFKEYLKHAPKDDHLYVGAHYDLIEASMDSLLRDPEKYQKLVQQADAANNKRVPIFNKVTEANFPKMQQAKAMLNRLELYISM